MNLINLYQSLTFPENGSIKTFNTIQIPGFTNFRIAINFNSYPVLLISVANNVGTIAKNFRLKHLQVEQNVECKIYEKDDFFYQTFSVITFTSNDRDLQECFLKFSETFIKTLGNNPTQQKFIDSLNKFVEIFRFLNDTPTNTVHGLWTELFLIDNAYKPDTLLNFWHVIPEEKFDFNSGVEKIEVKSNSNFERIHTFSSEQLNPPTGTQVLIASIFIRENSKGLSISNLLERITEKVNNIELLEKLNELVFRTLGNSLEQSIKIKFDYHLAKESLQFYYHQDVSKIEAVHIPNGVSSVRYMSDLSELDPISIALLNSKGELFSSI